MKYLKKLWLKILYFFFRNKEDKYFDKTGEALTKFVINKDRQRQELEKEIFEFLANCRTKRSLTYYESIELARAKFGDRADELGVYIQPTQKQQLIGRGKRKRLKKYSSLKLTPVAQG